VPDTVARRTVSDANGDMAWSYGMKPWLLAAAGVRPDGTWVLAACNNTSDRYKPAPVVRVEPTKAAVGEARADDKDALDLVERPKTSAAPELPPPSKWEREQGLHLAHEITVTFELPKAPKLVTARFLAKRTNGQATMKDAGEVQAVDGKVVVIVPPMELVTLEAR
jgi:hypothetical protein